MAFTEFYCNASTGSNLNAGSETGGAARLTYASGTWVASTGVFTVASGNPNADGVVVGDFASVYADGATVAVFIGRVTAKDTTTITVSLTAKSGTAPTDGTSNRTLKIGGTWKGPNGAEAFPFNFVSDAMNDGTNRPRVNLKNNATYSITAAMTHTVAGHITWQGYASTPGDLGRATIDGGTSGTSYVLFTATIFGTQVADLIFQNNGATGSASGVVFGGANFLRCVVSNVRGAAFTVGTAVALECEAYAYNLSNTAALGGFVINDRGGIVVRCIAHDATTGANCHGFIFGAQSRAVNCIADTVGGSGYTSYNSTTMVSLFNCDAYNCTGSGVDMALGNVPGQYIIENCNFVKNGAWGINGGGTGVKSGLVTNCRFGAGTQANTSGTSTYATSTIVESGCSSYANDVTPWTDPANGDFRISLAAAKGAGRGGYTQTSASYSGTVASLDIGAAQAVEAASSGGSTSVWVG